MGFALQGLSAGRMAVVDLLGQFGLEGAERLGRRSAPDTSRRAHFLGQLGETCNPDELQNAPNTNQAQHSFTMHLHGLEAQPKLATDLHTGAAGNNATKYSLFRPVQQPSPVTELLDQML